MQYKTKDLSYMAEDSKKPNTISPNLKKAIRYTGIAVAVPVVVVIALSLLLYFPP